MADEIERLTAAQVKADEVIRAVGETPDGGRLLRVAVTDTETEQRLATGFVNYRVDEPQAVVGRVAVPFDLTPFDRYRVRVARKELAAAGGLDMSDAREMARTLGRLEIAVKQLLEVFDEHNPDGQQ
ncbi:hypothetical protein [Streptomyces sp. NPDC048521]|uniref:hypothetical protein n=1 Tax=Streptomyces sp. NPDC048521 TaxID=3365566 RepID=UPI0037199D75